MKKEFLRVTKSQTLAKSIAFLGIFSISLLSCKKNDDYNGSPTPTPLGATVMSAAGDSAAIVGTLNQFRSLLGDSLNTVPGKTGGRREVNWDAVPPAFTNANNFPFAFFNSTTTSDPPGRKRGLVMLNTGTNFKVDSTGFAEIDPSYASQFQPFSKKRLFANAGSNISSSTFQVPGTASDAFVKGFGVIFSDVDSDNSTSVEYFSGSTSLGVFKAPAHPASGSFSFLGVRFASAKVTAVKITCGNGVLGAGTKDVSNGGTKDLVVMDDFLYNEPTAQQ